METLALFTLLAIIGWQLLNIRTEIKSQRTSTTLYMSVESNEIDEKIGIPRKSIQIRKKLSNSIQVVPGMQYSIPGDSRQIMVTRVVFDEIGRGIHLSNRQVPESQVDDEAKSYARGGWQSDA